MKDITELGIDELADFMPHCVMVTRQHTKQLTKEGVGTVFKQAESLTREQEGTLWSREIFSLSCGCGLIYALFRYNCKLFGLHGADEHRELIRVQFEVGSDKAGRFVHFKCQEGLKDCKVECKDLRNYAHQTLETVVWWICSIITSHSFLKRDHFTESQSVTIHRSSASR